MTQARWDEIGRLFDELAELPRAQQDRRLAELEATEPDVADEVRGLLAADAQADGMLDHSLDESVPDLPLLAQAQDWQTPAGLELGPYRLIEAVGEGGMGEVWRAERIDGQFDQQVAIKLLKRGLDTQAVLRRFLQERRILARLDHPGIVGLLDGGMSPDGRPWFAMAHVDGQPVREHARVHRLGTRARVELVARVADAVAYAHSRLIVHRDLKPSNVLVTANGEPRLLDFGIAKLLEATTDETLTGTSTRVLSPAYAAPEQILGEPVGTATDVYALGVLLYELLTGSLPHQRSSRDPTLLASELSRQTVVTRASQTLARQALEQVHGLYGPDTEGPRLARQIAGDLDVVLATALRPEPDRRYASAAAFAADLRAWLAGRPVQARGDSLRYRSARFLRRHALAVTAATAVVVALVAGLTVALWQGERARQQALRAEAVQGFLIDIFRTNTSNQPDPVAARATTARELLDIGAERIGSALHTAPAARLTVLDVLAELYHDLGETDQAVHLRRESLLLARAVHGEQSEEVVEALLELALSLHDSGEIAQRGEILETARTILDRRRSAPILLQAALHRALANHYITVEPSRAVVYADAAVSLRQRLPPDADLVEMYYVQGVAHHAVEQIEQAMAALTRAIETSEALEGYPNPTVPRFYVMLALIQFQRLDIEGALQSKRRAYDAALAMQGPNHVDTIQSGMRLGRRLFFAGHTEEGLVYLAQALDRVLAVRGADDPSHLPQIQASYGMALLRAGAVEQGHAALQSAAVTLQHHRGSNVFTAQVLEFLALAQIELGLGDEAATSLAQAAAMREAAGQPIDSRAWNRHVEAQARLATQLGDTEGARTWLQRYVIEPGQDGRPSLDQIEASLLRAELAQLHGDWPATAAHADETLTALASLLPEAVLPLQQAQARALRGEAALANGQVEAACADLHAAAESHRQRLLETSRERQHTADLLARHCSPAGG